ncbi:conserved hypothetical protein [Leishmania mexicana MHOM/GT/2001/U1103]|uniref:Transmembrane protein n=1 Tax=Leishmania mexicana (strain MHOM/GT/2001/U1103) TaxID=929439 RepID=E9ARC1_LEIMU|nr:conserved hypothetical protein [Leishmania mexicana MHOM/GT/2001/U1103]CBZ25508.1 conserved hypothetical protein [Leishmania mexicana MHOM/GT/2001/U1103]
MLPFICTDFRLFLSVSLSDSLPCISPTLPAGPTHIHRKNTHAVAIAARSSSPPLFALVIMEFFQVVDPVTLEPASYAHVALELAFAVACAVLLGVCLHVLPERLVRCSKTARAKVPREALAKAATPVSKPSVANRPSSSAAAPVATTPKAQAKATVSVASVAVAENTLNDVLEAFFEGETLLDEALLDATAPSVLPEEETSPANPMPGKPTEPPLKKTADFSTDLAAKMAKGLQIQACPARTASSPQAASKPHETKNTAEKELEDALDAYMEEQQLLDEAMLDSAVEAAHRT